MKNEFLRKPAGLIALLLLGVFLLIFGFHMLTQNVGRYIETTAVISKIEGVSILSKAYVSYTVDGRLYEDIPIGSPSSIDQVGTELPIYYDPDDPTVIESQGGSSFAKCALLLGALLIVYTIITTGRNRKTLCVRPVKKRK